MGASITTTNATGVIKEISLGYSLPGVRSNMIAVVTPDDGSKEVGVEIGRNTDNISGEAIFTKGDKVSYTITDSPSGAIATALKKVS